MAYSQEHSRWREAFRIWQGHICGLDWLKQGFQDGMQHEIDMKRSWSWTVEGFECQVKDLKLYEEF